MARRDGMQRRYANAGEQAPNPYGIPRGIMVSATPARKCPKDAGSSAALAETPKGHGLRGSYCGRVSAVDVRMTQRFNLPRTDAGVLNAQYKANTGSDGAGSKPA